MPQLWIMTTNGSQKSIITKLDSKLCELYLYHTSFEIDFRDI